jgi:Phage integrase family
VTRVNAHRAVLDRKSNEQSNKLTGNNAAMVSTVPTSPAERRDVTPVKETKLFDWLTLFESAKGIEAGICYCHRHLAAQWLEDSLGIKVEEVGHPETNNHSTQAAERRVADQGAPTDREVEALIEAAKANRDGHRDALMILLAYRHGLRAAEVVDLRWEQIDFKAAVLHVRRLKNGTPATHPSPAGSCERSAGISARPRPPRSYSRQIGEHHLRPQALPA